MGSTSERLRQRARCRVEWLAVAGDVLARDERVAAALVLGSEGRGEADELSDLELFVAVTDEVAEDVLASLDPSTFDGPGEVLTCVDVTDRAPEGVRAFVVAYASPVERLTVHWWFQQAGAAQLGSDGRVLVDKVGLVVADSPSGMSSTRLVQGGQPRAAGRPSRRADRLQERVTWFWTMAPSVAKWLARGWIDRADTELGRMRSVVEEATGFLHLQAPERYVEPAPVRPLARLRSVMVELGQLHEGLGQAGLEIPPIEAAYGWLELAEDLEAERWTPNSPSAAP